MCIWALENMLFIVGHRIKVVLASREAGEEAGVTPAWISSLSRPLIIIESVATDSVLYIWTLS